MTAKIIQFTPLSNWHAAYKQDEDLYLIQPILGIALSDDGSLEFVDGCSDGEISSIDSSNFYCSFYHPLNLYKKYYTKEEVDFIAHGTTFKE